MFDPCAPDYANTPASPRRAGFDYRPAGAAAAPAVSIVTPFFRPRELFLETALSVQRQSLQRWEWLIVNDASSDAESLAILEPFRSSDDARIRVLDHAENRGLSASRNTGIAAARAPYVYLLDDDDLIEPTTLEKLAWTLEGRPELAFANGWSVGFGAEEYVWQNGFHDGAGFLERNLASGRAMVRRSAFAAAGGYDETLRGGLEDWDFWLRCANAGIWGDTLPEFVDWYRRREDHGDRWENLRDGGQEAFLARARQRYPRVFAGEFPQVVPRWPMPFDPLPDERPFANPLVKDAKHLLLIVPWLTLGGADKFNLDVTEQLTRRGWQVSIAATREGDASWEPAFAQLTPDVFFLDHFAKRADRPRFLRYLIESRRPDVVLISNSELGYLVLPYLRAHCPEPVYVDHCHIEEEGWKSGGHARHAVGQQASLDRNLVTSEHLRRWMLERGADPERVEVVTVNVDTERWQRSPDARRRQREAWGVAEGERVILFAGRLCAQKRPRVLARTLERLAQRGVAFRAVVAGDGEDRVWLEGFLDERDLRDRIQLVGALSADGVRDAMSASDVLFLPSAWEGIALSVFEAMAMQLPVVGADVGGQRELVPPDCGVLLPLGEDDADVAAFADALAALLADPARRAELAQRARERVATSFRLDQMAERLIGAFERARADAERSPRPRVDPVVAREWATQAIEYLRLSDAADALWLDHQRLRDAGEAETPPPAEVPLAAELAAAPLEDDEPAEGAERKPACEEASAAGAELARLEASRAWRSLQRLKRNPLVRVTAKLRFRNDPGASWEPVDLETPASERLARAQASRGYRLLRAVDRAFRRT